MGVNEQAQGYPAATLDIDSVSSDTWRQRHFPIQGQGQRNVVQVVIKRSMLDAICKHGLSRTDVEVCGVLVGDCYHDERGPFIYVEGMIAGKHSDSKVAQVTFTSETWNHIQQELDQHFSEQRILGWYHTHPGFGIFLSAMDLFIHENFFNQSDQLALVYDPISGEDGLFVWHHGKAERHQYLVEEDAGPSSQSTSILAKPSLTAAAREGDDDLPARLRRIERRSSSLGWAFVATLIFAFAWPFAFAWCDLSAFIRKPSEDMEAKDSLPADLPRQPQDAGGEFPKRLRPSGSETPPSTPSTDESESQLESPNPAIPSAPVENPQAPKTLPPDNEINREQTKDGTELSDSNKPAVNGVEGPVNNSEGDPATPPQE